MKAVNRQQVVSLWSGPKDQDDTTFSPTSNYNSASGFTHAIIITGTTPNNPFNIMVDINYELILNGSQQQATISHSDPQGGGAVATAVSRLQTSGVNTPPGFLSGIVKAVSEVAAGSANALGQSIGKSLGNRAADFFFKGPANRLSYPLIEEIGESSALALL